MNFTVISPAVLGMQAVAILLLLTLFAQDLWARRLSVTVACGLALTVLLSLFAGCSPSQPYGPAVARFVEVHGG